MGKTAPCVAQQQGVAAQGGQGVQQRARHAKLLRHDQRLHQQRRPPCARVQEGIKIQDLGLRLVSHQPCLCKTITRPRV